ncbi:MAG: hypothetical protein MUC36_07975 [Planctomycetes bacterium]|nr:hypothetical protein [Planctomycetota bacterium]
MTNLRETLFGDVPLARWCAGHAGEPWSTFTTAAACIDRGDQAGAARALQKVLAQEGLESRHHLQAWTVLRELGNAPSAAEAKHVYGVVVDVPVETGVDSVAAYEDGTARYLNYSGAAIVWEAPDDRLARVVREVLATGQKIATVIGPWEGARPELPAGQTRLSMLTPSGIHFGQAPFETLWREPMARPLIEAATRLMQALIGLDPKARG